MRIGLVALGAALSVWAAVAEAQVSEVRILPATVDLPVGGRTDLLVTAYDGGGNAVPSATFTWTIENPAIAQVVLDDATPNIASLVGRSPGTTQVIGRVGGVTGTATVNVIGTAGGEFGTGPAAKLEIEPGSVDLLPLERISLIPRFLRADGEPAAPVLLNWTSLLATVASVDNMGVVTAISPGQGVVQAQGPGGIDARVLVRVANAPLGFDRPALSLAPAEVDTVRVTIPTQDNRRIPNGQLQFATTNETVVAVSPLGVVTGISAGTAAIVVRGFGEQEQLPVTVHRPVASADVFPNPNRQVIVPLTGTVEFEVTFLAADDSPVPEAGATWRIDDPSIVAFDPATLLLTGLEMGTTSVTARGPSNIEIVWNIEVVGGALALDRDRVGLGLGDQVQIPGSMLDPQGQPLAPATGISWTNLGPDVVDVDEQGMITAVGFGSARVIGSMSWGAADTVDVYVQGEVFVTRFGADGAADIYAFNRDSLLALNQVTSDSLVEVAAAVSPDATRIAYVSTANDVQKIFVADADGSNPVQLTSTLTAEGSPAWTPDGGQIVFAANQNIWIMHADGSNTRQLSTIDRADDHPAVSHDGQTIAFTSSLGSESDIFLMSLDGTNLRNYTRSEDALERLPAWFPNGDLAYVSEQGQRRRRTTVVVRSNLTTGATAILTPASFEIDDFAVAGDGSVLALIVRMQEDRNQLNKLYLLPVANPQPGAPVEVPGRPGDQFFFPAFKPSSGN